jgi:hypothetical protein
MGDVEKRKFLALPGFELRPLDRPACSYSGSVKVFGTCFYSNERLSMILLSFTVTLHINNDYVHCVLIYE